MMLKHKARSCQEINKWEVFIGVTLLHVLRKLLAPAGKLREARYLFTPMPPAPAHRRCSINVHRIDKCVIHGS